MVSYLISLTFLLGIFTLALTHSQKVSCRHRETTEAALRVVESTIKEKIILSTLFLKCQSLVIKSKRGAEIRNPAGKSSLELELKKGLPHE